MSELLKASEHFVGKYEISDQSPLETQLDQLTEIVKTMNNPPVLFILPGDELGTVVERDGEYLYNPIRKDAALNALLSRWVSFVAAPTSKYDSGVRNKMSKELVQAYMGAGNWEGVPVVRRKVPAPVVGRNMEVAWDAGYSASARTFVTESVQVSDALRKREISPEDAKRAGAYLLGWFRSFPFVDRRQEADALGLALSPYLMDYLVGAPIPGGAAMAREPGNGKTECMAMIGILGQGARVEMQPLPRSDKMQTHLTTLLKASERVVLFDNVKSDLDNDALESLLTSRTWIDRKFQTQDPLRLANDTLWLFSVNNPTLSTDMLRRLVIISLDKKKHPVPREAGILAKAASSKQSIQEAMMTLIINWVNQGGKAGSVSLDGYEGWSTVVSGILEAAGISGFTEARGEMAADVYTENDDDAELINAIYAVMRTEAFSPGELWQAIDRDAFDLSSDPKGQVKKFVKSALNANGKNASMSVGKRLSKISGRQVPGASTTLNKIRTSPARYQMVEVPGEPRTDTWMTMYQQSMGQ